MQETLYVGLRLGESSAPSTTVSTLRGFFTSATGASPHCGKNVHFQNGYVGLLVEYRSGIASCMYRLTRMLRTWTGRLLHPLVSQLSRPLPGMIFRWPRFRISRNITLALSRNAHLVRFVKAPNPHIGPRVLLLRTIVPTSCCVRFQEAFLLKARTDDDSDCTRQRMWEPASEIRKRHACEVRFLSGVRGGLLPVPSSLPSRD